MSGFDREKHLKPLVAGGLIILLLGGIWAYSGYRKTLSQLERKTVSARNELTQLKDGLREYRELQGQLQQRKPENANSNLISTVEDATQQIAARSQLIYVRPQPDKTREELTEEAVEIKLEKLKLNQLVDLLYRLGEADQVLKVSQLRVRTRFDNPELLDTVMILSRFREKVQ